MPVEITPEGYMKRNAVFTRTGDFRYSRDELGLDGDGDITIERTYDTLAHPETMNSLRGAPISVLHKDIDSRNWKDHVVGWVVGEPSLLSTGEIHGDIMLVDKDAFAALDAGLKELSLGYEFAGIESNPAGGYKTVGPLRIDHVAIVDRGRAGPAVRILDKLPEEVKSVEKSEVEKMIADAIKGAMDSQQGNKEQVTAESVAKIVAESMKPLTDSIEKADQEKKAAEAKKQADEAAKKLEDTVRQEERQRFSVLTDASPFLTDEQKKELADSEPKAILVAALKDSIADAESKTVDYLLGALAVAKEKKEAEGNLPAGIKPWGDKSNVSDAREKARIEYAEALDKRFKEAGGTQ